METGLCILLTFLLQQVGQDLCVCVCVCGYSECLILTALLRFVKFTESSSTNQTVHPPGQSRCRLVVSSATEFGVKRVGFANPQLSFWKASHFMAKGRERTDKQAGEEGCVHITAPALVSAASTFRSASNLSGSLGL
ncbi:hypothetical protein ILYODFUR_021565 [Ilyodon furcidens]|uniref:Secreted protein n=1 Tax=Ilyodon furcidens TaxID=33524 RepID=A0ABV0UXB9_9TELE